MKLLDWNYFDRHKNGVNDIKSHIDSVDSSTFTLNNYSSTLSERIALSGQVYIRQILSSYDYPDYLGPKDFDSWNIERNIKIYKKLNEIGNMTLKKPRGRQIISDIDPFGEELWYD